MKKILMHTVLMLFMVACVFFSCSNGRLSNRASTAENITPPEIYDMKHYKSDDWYFSLDIPNSWKTFPYPPANPASALVGVNSLVTGFKSNDDGLNALLIFISPHDPELFQRDKIQKQLASSGCKKLAFFETILESKKVLILDFEMEIEGATSHAHVYMIPYKSSIYILAFYTTRQDTTFELYDRITETFEFHEPPVVHGTKKYVNPDEDFSLEIPARWKAFPHSKNSKIICFGTPENGTTAIVYSPSHTPGEMLEDYRTRVQKMSSKPGWKEFTNSETVIKGRKTLLGDSNNGSVNLRYYFFEDGDYKYSVAFYASNKDGIASDRLEEYDRVMRSYNFRKKTEAVGMKEYTGSDIRRPLASGMKRYITHDGDFTVDVPGNWQPSIVDDMRGKTYLFDTPEKSLAVFHPRVYNPGLALENWRDNQERRYIDSGFSILGKSEIVIDGNKAFIIDIKKGASNTRNFIFKEGDYIYSALFYINNTEGMPDDNLEEYERVMKSINILK